MGEPTQSGILPVRPPSVGDDRRVGRTLGRLASVAPDIEGLWKRDARAGDWVLVETRNSTYTLVVQADLSVVVTGGWFAAAPLDEGRVQVSGCTWGGSAILVGMMAAPGMCVEFSNGVRTTRVRTVRVIRDVAGGVH
ncbi:MAG TPA: hypothetical protein VMM93_08730 [Vicinamibacterales bacterium]|nr:hypothetical protein [Vicinamibacterales bacterium]